MWQFGTLPKAFRTMGLFTEAFRHGDDGSLPINVLRCANGGHVQSVVMERGVRTSTSSRFEVLDYTIL